MAKTILLGEGVFTVGGKDIGLTRGGGQFTVTREYRRVEADGDRGPVKGRIRLVSSEATLTMNQLEILVDDLARMFPATKLTNDAETTTFTAKQDIEDADYTDTVTWTGRTMDGKACVITLKNAINWATSTGRWQTRMRLSNRLCSRPRMRGDPPGRRGTLEVKWVDGV